MKAVYLLKSGASRHKKRWLPVQFEVNLDAIKIKRLTVKRLQRKQTNPRRESFANRDVSMQNIEEEKSNENHKTEEDE